MAEPGAAPPEGTRTRRINGIGALLALFFLAVAAVGLSGAHWWAWSTPGPWIVALLGSVVGMAMVVTAGWGRRRPGG